MEEVLNDVGSCKMHSEDSKAGLETNRKRTVKTPAQLQELEKFYCEHRYPTESMKSQLAVSIGLTEKQVSGWFCHRRLKDKRLLEGDIHVIGKQDRSSGVIQVLDSGQRQDSCGSTKQGDGRNADAREVESVILTRQECSAVEPTNEHGGHYSGDQNRMDDTSSGSSSSLPDMSLSDHHRGDTFDVATSRYLIPKFPMDVNGLKSRRGPSGYLKVKGQTENSAITAVKRQLGKHYREDGPPLGVEFDPLPAGAFDDPMQNPVDETFYSKEATLPASPEFSISLNQFKISKGREYDSISFGTPQVYARDISGCRSRDVYRMKYTPGSLTKSVSNGFVVQPLGVDSSVHKYNDVLSNSSKGEYESSNSTIKGSEQHYSFDPIHHGQIPKDVASYTEWMINENRAKIPYKNDAFAMRRKHLWQITNQERIEP